ncbi:MAG: BatA domain-containing protein, partial [Balneolaceae bacterium]
MSFLNPFLLLGIMAVAVPLLIHLINLRRPTKIRFSTLSFFDSLQESAMRRIQIKRWLLLALRMAAILMLAMALARPFIPSGLGLAGAGEQPGRIGILIDNSPGMDQVDRDGPFIDQAKQVALDIISRTRSDDRIGVEVTNGDPLNLPVLNAVSAASRVEELETVNKGNFLAANMESLVNRLETDRPAGRIYFITDGQATQFDDLREAETVFGLEQDLQVILVGEDTQSNTAVTEVRLESELISRDQPAVVSASVRNFGRSPVRNHFLSLDVGDEIAGQHQLSLEAGESAWYDFEVLPG